jgi:hypothetical protein
MKLSVLQECRRVIRRGGQMLFSVISIEPSLSLADHQAAVAAGPSFKAVSTDYPRMLADSGWFMRWRLDLTSPYLAAVKRMLRKEEENAQGLIELLGEAEYTESIVRRRRTVEALERPLICRELFSAIAAA